MERIDTIEETYGFYAQMGGVRHALPHGIEYRFPATTPTGGHSAREPRGTADANLLGQGGGEEVSKDVIRLLGDLSSFVYSEVDFTAPADHLSRTRFSGKYLGISLNTDGAIQTYSARNDTRILNEGLHAFVSISSIPSFMRIAKGTHLRYVGISLFEPFFETHGLRTPPGFWEAANHVLNATPLDLPPVAMICRLMHNCPLQGTAYLDFLRGQCIAVAALVVDYVASHAERPVRRLSGAERESLEQAKEIIRRELAHPPTVAALAQRVGLNRNKLQAGFRATEGKSVSEYVRGQRMDRALVLLDETNLPVAAVSERVGYQSKANFHRTFRSTYGMSPAEARALVGSGLGRRNGTAVTQTSPSGLRRPTSLHTNPAPPPGA